MQVLQLTPPETLPYRIISGDKPRVGELTQCLPNFTAPTAFLPQGWSEESVLALILHFRLGGLQALPADVTQTCSRNGHKVIFPTQVCAGFHNDFLSTRY